MVTLLDIDAPFNDLESLLEYIDEAFPDEPIAYFRNPDFVTAIVGITDDLQLVYSYERMVQFSLDHGDVENYIDAVAYVDSCLGIVPYMSGIHPIIINELPYGY